jgi:hypothetical protein
VPGVAGARGRGSTAAARRAGAGCGRSKGPGVHGRGKERRCPPADEELEIKRRTGLVPDESLLFDRLTGAEFLEFVGRMYGLARCGSRKGPGSPAAARNAGAGCGGLKECRAGSDLPWAG